MRTRALLLLVLLAGAASAQRAEATHAVRTLRELRQEGRYEEALAFAEALPAPVADETRVAGERAQLLMRLDRTAEAAELLKAYADVTRAPLPLAMARAHLRIAAGDPRGAAAIARAGLAQGVGTRGWQAVLVRALVAGGDAAEAREALDAMPDDTPDFLRRDLTIDVLRVRAAVAAREAEGLGRAVALLEQALALDGSRADVRLDLVLELVRWHREDRAEALAREGLASLDRPGARADMLYALGVVQRARMDLEGSLESFGRALELAPHHERAQVGLARSHLKAGRVDEAARALDALLARAPGSTDALLAKGEAELARREGARAREALERLVDLRPDHERALYLLARAHAMEGREQDAALSMRRYEELAARR